MYGMIHKAAQAFAIERLGEVFWTEFLDARGLTDAAFITAESYPDEVTFGLVAGLAEATGMPQSDLLEAFGAYWVEFARKGPYANMMAIGGDDLPSFIGNLNRMHAGLAMAMPGCRMPSFFLLAATPQRMRLRYVSQRRGLEPFVLGLLRGLCDMFAVKADIRRDADATDGVIFDVQYQTALSA